MADLICDTNVFYNLAFGNARAAAIRAAGHRLLATPVTVLELISHVTSQNFGTRKPAAQAVLDHTDELLPDPETVLAEAWALPPDDPGVDWRNGLKALAGAPNFDDLVQGVPDVAEGVLRRVDVPLARSWRAGHYDDFEQQMIAAVEDYVPGYSAARAKGLLVNASGPQRDKARGVFTGPEAQNWLLTATRLRAWLGRDGPPPPLTAEQFAEAAKRLDPYLRVYRCYFLDVVTTAYAPQPNDFGDLECFVYLSGGRKVATSEKRWLDVATRAGFGNEIVDPCRV